MAHDFTPQVMLRGSEPVIVFGKGRLLFQAIEVLTTIRVVKLTAREMRELRPCMRNGEDYPVKRAASWYLNHSIRTMTARAKAVLRGLVARKPKAAVPQQAEQLIEPAVSLPPAATAADNAAIWRTADDVLKDTAPPVATAADTLASLMPVVVIQEVVEDGSDLV